MWGMWLQGVNCTKKNFPSKKFPETLSAKNCHSIPLTFCHFKLAQNYAKISQICSQNAKIGQIYSQNAKIYLPFAKYCLHKKGFSFCSSEKASQICW